MCLHFVLCCQGKVDRPANLSSGDAVMVHSQIRESSLKRYGVKEAIKPQMGSFLPIKFYFLHPLGKGILAEGLSLLSLPPLLCLCLYPALSLNSFRERRGAFIVHVYFCSAAETGHLPLAINFALNVLPLMERNRPNA